MNTSIHRDDQAFQLPQPSALSPGLARGAQVEPGDFLVLGFEQETDALSAAGTAALVDWVAAWLHDTPQGLVLMAHDLHGGEALRATRLRALRDAVQALGVPRENIKYTDKPVRLCVDALQRSALPPPAPADAVVLKMIDPFGEGEEVRPVASCFGALAPLN